MSTESTGPHSHQFYITHCARSDSVLNTVGFSVRAASTGPDDLELLKLAMEYPAYELPMEMWGKKPDKSQAPRRLARVAKPNGDGLMVVHTNYLEKDTMNRDRSYFSHIMILPKAKASTVEVLRSWNSGHWRMEYRSGETKELARPAGLPEGADLSDETVKRFLAPGDLGPGGDLAASCWNEKLRRSYTSRSELAGRVMHGILLRATKENARNRLVIHAEPGVVAALIYAAALLLPPDIVNDLTFTTFEPAHRGLKEFRRANVLGTYLGQPNRGLDPELVQKRAYVVDCIHPELGSTELLGALPSGIKEMLRYAGEGNWALIDSVRRFCKPNIKVSNDIDEAIKLIDEAIKLARALEQIDREKPDPENLVDLQNDQEGRKQLQNRKEALWPRICDLAIHEDSNRRSIGKAFRTWFTEDNRIQEIARRAFEQLQGGKVEDWRRHWRFLGSVLDDPSLCAAMRRLLDEKRSEVVKLEPEELTHVVLAMPRIGDSLRSFGEVIRPWFTEEARVDQFAGRAFAELKGENVKDGNVKNWEKLWEVLRFVLDDPSRCNAAMERLLNEKRSEVPGLPSVCRGAIRTHLKGHQGLTCEPFKSLLDPVNKEDLDQILNDQGLPDDAKALAAYSARSGDELKGDLIIRKRVLDFLAGASGGVLAKYAELAIERRGENPEPARELFGMNEGGQPRFLDRLLSMSPSRIQAKDWLWVAGEHGLGETQARFSPLMFQEHRLRKLLRAVGPSENPEPLWKKIRELFTLRFLEDEPKAHQIRKGLDQLINQSYPNDVDIPDDILKRFHASKILEEAFQKGVDPQDASLIKAAFQSFMVKKPGEVDDKSADSYQDEVTEGLRIFFNGLECGKGPDKNRAKLDRFASIFSVFFPPSESEDPSGWEENAKALKKWIMLCASIPENEKNKLQLYFFDSEVLLPRSPILQEKVYECCKRDLDLDVAEKIITRYDNRSSALGILLSNLESYWVLVLVGISIFIVIFILWFLRATDATPKVESTPSGRLGDQAISPRKGDPGPGRERPPAPGPSAPSGTAPPSKLPEEKTKSTEPVSLAPSASSTGPSNPPNAEALAGEAKVNSPDGGQARNGKTKKPGTRFARAQKSVSIPGLS